MVEVRLLAVLDDHPDGISVAAPAAECPAPRLRARHLFCSALTGLPDYWHLSGTGALTV